MERIKQALERARTERERASLAPPGTPTTAAAPRSGTPSRETAPIVYSQTQRVEVEDRQLRRRRVVAAIDDGPLAAAYKVLRTQVLHRLQLNDWNSIVITSPTPSDGKTLTAVNLAVALAKEVNHTVLLVDLDLRHPSIHTYFDFQPKLGVGDHLVQGVDLSEILFNPAIDGLVVLPGRDHISKSSETMSSPRMVHLVEELKTRYPSRIVLFDVPPLLSGDDTIAFVPYVDAVLLVARESRTRLDDLTMAAGLLNGTPLLGTVLNESQEKLDAYY